MAVVPVERVLPRFDIVHEEGAAKTTNRKAPLGDCEVDGSSGGRRVITSVNGVVDEVAGDGDCGCYQYDEEPRGPGTDGRIWGRYWPLTLSSSIAELGKCGMKEPMPSSGCGETNPKRGRLTCTVSEKAPPPHQHALLVPRVH